ncbi:hypothetical protein PIB30_043598 [Stylosanthes scabra]|uniref:Uncharacterized protein n=1 Tax=Stylosanthes scabra TaxID=79078 RepID=A0ABU6TFB0_9FABA|nr:hypothetical protein [Stylosanthes scabra]
MELELESSSTPTEQAPSRSSCFPCFAPRRRSSSWWQRVRTASWSHNNSPRTPPPTAADRWWSRGLKALKKLREWSELLAGPRWKTFIRRTFNRNNNRASKRVAANYQYDPLSYALNFDEGQNGDFYNEPDIRNFSTRYASANVKSVTAAEEEVGCGSGKDDVVLV